MPKGHLSCDLREWLLAIDCKSGPVIKGEAQRSN